MVLVKMCACVGPSGCRKGLSQGRMGKQLGLWSGDHVLCGIGGQLREAGVGLKPLRETLHKQPHTADASTPLWTIERLTRIMQGHR